MMGDVSGAEFRGSNVKIEFGAREMICAALGEVRVSSEIVPDKPKSSLRVDGACERRHHGANRRPPHGSTGFR